MKINYPAVIVAAIIHFMIGGLWYGAIFGNLFLRIIGWTPEQQEQIVSQTNWTVYLMAFVCSFVLAYILAHFVQYTKSDQRVRRHANRLLALAGFCSYHSTSHGDF